MNPGSSTTSPDTVSKGWSIPADQKVRYQCGTLQYSRGSLSYLFFCLLTGDFCFNLMALVDDITVLHYSALGASAFVISLVRTTIPNVLNMVLNPVISTASDRYRSRWGRRIPFMLFSAPFISLSLVLLGYTYPISEFLHRHGLGPMLNLSRPQTTVFVMSVLLVFYNLSMLFSGTVFWYLFNDVVPRAYIARFLSLFRLVSSLAGVVYNYFIFRHAMTHMTVSFVAVGILYLAGFVFMCFSVKEGDYPPPEPYENKGKSPILAMAKTYLRECFCHRLYVYFFLFYTMNALSGAVSVFSVLSKLSLGVTLDQLGKLGAVASIGSMLLIYPAGILADRLHPFRLMIAVNLLIACITPVGFIFLLHDFVPRHAFYILCGLTAVQLPLGVLFSAIFIPLQMRLFPKSRYGQFCSANAVVSAVLYGILGSLAAGGFMQWMKVLLPDTIYGKDFAYRTIPIWATFFVALSCFFLFLAYREWKKLGGLNSYRAPLPDGLEASDA